jgi:hypothetical protein
MGIVAGILVLLLVYGAVGLPVGAAFVFRGVNAVDAAAAQASILVRLLLLPGAAALWPVMLRRWLATARRALLPENSDGFKRPIG